jgi:Cytochrome bd terminal oxidase subunit II/Cytochrome bd terminal oxidase subunit I
LAAVLSGWFTAEVGRQPWVVWGLLRTADAVTPTLTGPEVLATLIGYVVVYTVIFAFGIFYIYELLHEGPTGDDTRPTGATAMRPMAAAGPAETATGSRAVAGELAMNPTWIPVFWAAAIAFAILVYVVLDGYDLGVGILFGTTRGEHHRITMMNAIAPFWDGNETWPVLIGAGLFATFPMVYAIFLPAFYLPIALMLLGLIFRGVAFEFRQRSQRMRPVWDWGFFLGSLTAAFVQGAAIGTMVQELPVVDGRYAGGAFEWVTPFSMFCGAGLVLGYALLGAHGWC